MTAQDKKKAIYNFVQFRNLFNKNINNDINY